MTHLETYIKSRVATPCTAASMTFGGRCLNCGFEPPIYPRGFKNRCDLPQDRCECPKPSVIPESVLCQICLGNLPPKPYVGSLDEEMDNQEFLDSAR